MAARKNAVYGQRYVKGSLAYDYANPELYPEYEYGKQLDIPAKPKVREKVVENTQIVTKQSISPMAIFGYAAAAIMMVLCLFAYIQFTKVSAEAAALERQITELSEEQSKLTIKYESALNLTEIEDYAINTLGMRKPHNDQIRYISSSSKDKAVILDSSETAGGGKTEDLLDSMSSYFGD